MKPEDIDKLFRERLGDMPRTPSSEAWQRLQDRLQPPPKRKVIPMWWSIAATVAFLLLMGSYLYLNQLYRPGLEDLAGTGKPAQQATRPSDSIRFKAGPAPEQAQTPEMVAEAAPKKASTEKPGGDHRSQPESGGLIAGLRTGEGTQPAATPVPGTTAKAAKQTGPGQEIRALKTTENTDTPPMMALERPAIRPAQVNTPAPAAPAAETIEVVILKQEPASFLADAGDLDAEAAEAGPSRKGKIVRGIFRQVKNIAAGEKVDLSDVGLENYTIAFETQIGNRKISKKINF